MREDKVDMRWMGEIVQRNEKVEEKGMGEGVIKNKERGIVWIEKRMEIYGEGIEEGKIVMEG